MFKKIWDQLFGLHNEKNRQIVFENPQRTVVMTLKPNPTEKNFRCIVCGYLGLEKKQYAKQPNNPRGASVVPPFAKVWGEASYEVCSCCGFEAGNDDSFSNDPQFLSNYLKEWTQEGCQWLAPEEKPLTWNLDKQLNESGIEQ